MNNILITGPDYNRTDACRCAAWLLEYFRKQALLDGIPLECVTGSVAELIALRNELREPARMASNPVAA